MKTDVSISTMPISQLDTEEDPYCMTWNDFVKHCKDFIKKSDELNDGWVFSDENNKLTTGELYLMKKSVKHLDATTTVITDNCEIDNNLCFIGDSVSFWEYHIVYSPSYCVPTLYFNAWKRDGSILTMDEITKLNESPEVSGFNKICILSQQEHPILRRPFYYIHPCDTVNILKSCKAISTTFTNVNPLTTWLSTISSVAQIHLPLQYGYEKQ